MVSSISPSMLGTILSIIVGVFFWRFIVRFVQSRGGGKLNRIFDSGTTDLSFRGKTSEQKSVIKYFKSTGILGAIFRMPNETFDNILRRKISEHGAKIGKRALEAHGMDADEVKEIPPIYVGNYFAGSRYFKMFLDHTFRASEYQMTYLMFSDKQLYAYSHTFDLTSANTTEQTQEYFYEDITSVDVVQTKIDLPRPRPLGYFFGGIAIIILGIIFQAVGMQVAVASKREAARVMDVARESERKAAREMETAKEKERSAAREMAIAKEKESVAAGDTSPMASRRRLDATREIAAAEERKLAAAREMAAAEERKTAAEREMAVARAKVAAAEKGGAMVVGNFLGLIATLAGLIVLFFMGYTRSVVDSMLMLKLTVCNNVFECTMQANNLAAIQGMKAKIREKKVV